MRTTKRFTLAVLDRFRREGRGIGTFGDFKPWHRVGRGDPASRGRSHLIPWRERPRELLSDLEWVTFIFVTMMQALVIDVREQFPLSLNDRAHELGDYEVRSRTFGYAGTLALAKALGIKHPRVRGDACFGHWVMTTDLLVALRDDDGRPNLLAIACKYNEQALSRRARQLLELEREYWRVRGVEWLLITPALFDNAMALTLRQTMPWAFGDPVAEDDLRAAVQIVWRYPGRSRTFVLGRLADAVGSSEKAQRAYWQAAWGGLLTIDLRATWRPHVPPKLLSPTEFKALNPVASRRTSWT